MNPTMIKNEEDREKKSQNDNEKFGISQADIAIQINSPSTSKSAGPKTSTPSSSPLRPARSSTTSRSPTPPTSIAEAVRRISQNMMDPIMIQTEDQREISASTDYEIEREDSKISLSEASEISIQQQNEKPAVSDDDDYSDSDYPQSFKN